MDARHFDLAMLVCHTLSTANQFLLFGSLLSVASGLAFEVALLVVKTALEISLDALTKDLVVHHALYFLAAASARQYPADFAAPAVFVNIIHLPLALNYARRMSGLARGGGLDACFGATWVVVVGGRSAMLAAQCAKTALRGEWAVRWLFLPSLAGQLVLDVQWTRETFYKRPLPLGWPLLFITGAVLGGGFEHAAARGVWAAGCIATLHLVASAMVGRARGKPRGDSDHGERSATTD